MALSVKKDDPLGGIICGRKFAFAASYTVLVFTLENCRIHEELRFELVASSADLYLLSLPHSSKQPSTTSNPKKRVTLTKPSSPAPLQRMWPRRCLPLLL
jgi:hypothetical protein